MRKMFGGGQKEGANDTTNLQADSSSGKSDPHDVKSSRLGRLFGGAKQPQKAEVSENTGDLIENTSETTTALPIKISPQDPIDPSVKTDISPNIQSSLSNDSKNVETNLDSLDDREQPDERKKTISFAESNDPKTPDSKKEREDKLDFDEKKNQSNLEDFIAGKGDVEYEPLADSKISTTGTRVLEDKGPNEAKDNDAVSAPPSSLSAFGSRMGAGFSRFGRKKGTDSSLDSSTHSIDSNITGKDGNEIQLDKDKGTTNTSSTNAKTAITATAPIAADGTTTDFPLNSSVDLSSPSKLISTLGSRMSAGSQQFGRRKLVDSSVDSADSKSKTDAHDSSPHDDTAEKEDVKKKNENKNESESVVGKEIVEDISISSKKVIDSDKAAKPEILNVPKVVAPLFVPLQSSLLLLDVGTVVEALYGVGFEWFPGVIKEVILPPADVTKAESVPPDISESSAKIEVDKKSKLKDFMNKSKKNMVDDLSKDKSKNMSLEKEVMYSIVYDDGDKEICSRLKIRVPSKKERQPGIL